MLTWNVVPSDEGTLVIRWTPQGVGTIECDCPNMATALRVAAQHNAAERERVRIFSTVTDEENAREIERLRWLRRAS